MRQKKTSLILWKELIMLEEEEEEAEWSGNRTLTIREKTGSKRQGTSIAEKRENIRKFLQ